MNRRLVVFCLLCLTVLCIRCGNPSETADSVDTSVTETSASTAFEPAAPTNDLTKNLFSSLVSKELGDEHGLVELRDTSGILIHPGATTATSATFRLQGEYTEMGIRLFIAPLGPEGGAIPEAGTVNVSVAIDGKSVLNSDIDRDSPVEQTIDVSGGEELTIRVDNGNGKAWYDWLFLSLDSAR